MIEAQVKKRFGEFVLEAHVKDDKFICLTGRNGSGKSTLLNIFAGILRPNEGSIRVNSKMVTNTSHEKRNTVLVASDSFLPHLDVKNHLKWGAKMKGLTYTDDRIAHIRTALGINYEGKVSKLSLGMRNRVALASAFLSSPSLILIDEIFSNIDNRREFITSFRELTNSAGIDVLFATQESEDALLSDHHYNLEAGKSTRLF